MPLSRRATSGRRSTASARARTGDATSTRRDTRESRRRTSFVAQEQGGGVDSPRSTSRRQTARAAAPRRGGGREKGGNNNAMLYAAIGGVALLVVIAIAASGQGSKSKTPAVRKPQATAPAPAKPTPQKKKGAKDDTPAWFKGPPKLDHVDDDKWDKTHKDTSVKNDLPANEIASRLSDARKLMKQVDATRKSEDRNALRRQVEALCNEVINGRNASDADRKEAQRLKWMAGKSQGVK